MVTVHEEYAQFRFFRPHARHVALAGDFNHWRTDNLRMVSSGDGYWVAAVRLSPGSHRFRYYCDGEWFCDFAAFGIEPGPFGWNAVVRIPKSAAKDGAALTPKRRLSAA
jgi:1,4-alpha-glucan branching enzyme